MKLIVLSVGRLKDGAERTLCEHYRARVQALAKSLGWQGLDIVELPEGRARSSLERQRDEAERLRAKIESFKEPRRLVYLDESGDATLKSTAFSHSLTAWREAAVQTTILLIGGADGFDGDVLPKPDRVLSFGALTLPHTLVRVLVLEQLYRAATLALGHPYHRE
jgi:23S rRNA (pseudouridine1915-N3)-methyltransferase